MFADNSQCDVQMFKNLSQLRQWDKLRIPDFGCRYLVNQGCITPLCDLLVCLDTRIVTVCLEGLDNILKVGEVERVLGNTGGVNLYGKYIDDAEGLENIENLQSHENNEI